MKDGGGEPTVDQENFHRESNAMRMIKHPKIIRLREKLQSENNYYLVLDYCEDGDLKMMLETKGVMPEGDAINALKQLAVGFQELHRLGIMHRDFKPANVFIHKGNFIIGDLGMAKKASATATKVGTPITMAPEVYEAQMTGTSYDSTVDLFSLGVTFYYMLYREWPWKVSSQILADKKQFSGAKLRFPKLSTLSGVTKDLLKKMIAVRSERISWTDLFAVLSNITIPKVFLPKEFDVQNRKLFEWGLLNCSKFNVQLPEPDLLSNETVLNPEPEIQKIVATFVEVEKQLTRDATQQPVEVQFWKLEMESVKFILQFFTGQIQFLKQVASQDMEYSIPFCMIVYQLILVAQTKARIIHAAAQDLISKKTPAIDDLPSIEAYLKTDHSKTVLQDLDKFKEAVQSPFQLNFPILTTPLLESCRRLYDSPSPIASQVTAVGESALQALLPYLPDPSDLGLIDLTESERHFKFLACVRAYQLIHSEDQLPQPTYFGESEMEGLAKKDPRALIRQMQLKWTQFFRKRITIADIHEVIAKIQTPLV